MENLINKTESLFKIMADKTRLLIIFSLFDMNERSVLEIARIIDKSQSLVSHQLKVLRNAKLVKTRREKQKIFYSLKDSHIQELIRIVKEHMEEK